MLFKVDASDSRPVFRQLADEVQRAVAVGVLKPGDPLPGIRGLAVELKVNANTVQHAYRVLEQEKTVEVRRGRGTFVAEPRPKEAPARRLRVAREIAERMLREGYRQGLLASDLLAALREIAPRAGESGPGGEEQV